MALRRTSHPFPVVRSLYFYWRVLGLCPFVPVEGGEMLRSTYIGFAHTTIMTLVYSIIYFRAVANRMNFVLGRETSMFVMSDITGESVEFLIVVTAWLGFALRQNELKRLLKASKNIHETSKGFGIGQDLGGIVKTAKIHTFAVNFVWLVLFCCDHSLVAKNKVYDLAIWMPFNIPRVITHNVMIMFIDAMLVMNKFFRLLNERICDLSQDVTSKPCSIVKRRRWASNNCGSESRVKPDPLEIYGRIHSDLVTLTKMIVNFFSLSIVLTLTVNFIQMASDFYLTCVLARDSKFSNWPERAGFTILCCYCCVHFGETVLLMAICESTANEANRAGSVVHKMLTSVNPKKYEASAQILSFRLLQRRLRIDLYGLFEMRLAAVHTIIGMVGSYVTIVMQLDELDILQRKIDRSLSQPWNGTSTTESH